jgi:ATP-dependent DNA ligase
VFEGAGLDGVIAKPRDLPYLEDQRVMFKVKHERTADCVVAGFRWHKKGPVVGSLLLGLNDEEGRLQHVGVSGLVLDGAAPRAAGRAGPLPAGGGAEHPWTGYSTPERTPGAMVSRWNAKKDLTFELLDPRLVVEVAYDHMEGRRFRHTAQFRRWRYDRDPSSCTYAQIERPVEFDLGDILARGGLPDSGVALTGKERPHGRASRPRAGRAPARERPGPRAVGADGRLRLGPRGR